MTEQHGCGDSVEMAASSKRDAAQALFAVTAQIGLALRESEEPVAELGTVIGHVAETLATLRTTPADGASERSTAEGLIDKLQAEVFAGIQRLQFYDRMVQHLSHLQNYLIGVANELGPGQAGERDVHAWEALHAKLRDRLISDEQRRLFDLFLSPDTPVKVSAQIPHPELSLPGSEELF
jgi:hypothetical protein